MTECVAQQQGIQAPIILVSLEGGAVIATVGISNASKSLVRVATRVIKSARAARSSMYSTAVIRLVR